MEPIFEKNVKIIVKHRFCVILWAKLIRQMGLKYEVFLSVEVLFVRFGE